MLMALLGVKQPARTSKMERSVRGGRFVAPSTNGMPSFSAISNIHLKFGESGQAFF
jgi:hypothetical protein